MEISEYHSKLSIFIYLAYTSIFGSCVIYVVCVSHAYRGLIEVYKLLPTYLAHEFDWQIILIG